VRIIWYNTVLTERRIFKIVATTLCETAKAFS
jgi:hypothetical protein